MSSHFRGSSFADPLVAGKTIMVFLLLNIMIIILETDPVMASAAGEDMIINPIVELSSRDELVHLAGYGEEKLSTVTISGKVLCHQDSCTPDRHHHHHPPPHDHADDHHHQQQRINEALVLAAAAASTPVSGASVAVFCGTSGKLRKSWALSTTTDEYGDFLIDLPSHLHAIPDLEKVCCVKLLHPPKNSHCRPAPASRGSKHKAIQLLSVEDGSRAYTASTIYLTTTQPSKSCRSGLPARNTKAN